MSLKDTWIDKVNTTTGLDGDDIMAEDINAIAQQAIQNEKDLKNKVEKKDGKGLSSNDFTNELKEKLEKIPENEGAEQVQADWNQNDETKADYIKNRPFHMEYEEDSQHDIELPKEHIVTINTLGKFARWRIPSTNSTVTQAGIIAGENYQITIDFEYGKYDIFFEKAFETTYQNNYGTQNKAVAIHFSSAGSSETNLIKEFYIRDNGSELFAEMRLNDEAEFSIGAFPVVDIYLDGKVKLWKATPIKPQHIQNLNKENLNEDFYKTLIRSVQSDMEQNDENDPSYVKNRTHYFIKNIIGEAHYTSEGTIPGMFDGICDLRIPKELVEVGKEYGYTINGKEGTFVFNDSYMEIEGLSGNVYDFGDNYDWQFSLAYGESVDVIFFDGGQLKKLDEMFIPDTIARAKDVSDVKDDVAKLDRTVAELIENSGGEGGNESYGDLTKEPQQINLLNPAEIEDGVYYTNATQSTGNYSASGLIPIKPDASYLFANTGIDYWDSKSKAKYIIFFDKNKNHISDKNLTNVKKFTTPSNAYYVRISFALNAREVVLIEGTYSESQNFVYVPYEHRKEANEIFITDNNAKGLSISAINGLVSSGKNLFDKTKATLNTYLNTYPSVAANDVSFVSDYIPVKAGNKYVITHTRTWVLYDLNYQMVSSAKNDNDNTVVEVSVDGYLRFCNFMTQIDTTQVEIGEVPTAFEEYKTVFADFALLNEKQTKQAEKIGGNVLYGKKWCVVGDSFTNEFSGTFPDDWYFTDGNFIGKSKVYGYLIADRNDMKVQWMANGGRTLATPADGSFTNTFSLSKYTEIDEDVDYITIMLGINDGHHNSAIVGGDDGEDMTGDIPLGTASDTTNATFYGAWNVVLPYLIEHHPKAHIGIIVSNGLDDISYRTATIEMAKKYSIPYIDLNGDERTQAMHRAQNTDLSESAKTLLLNKYKISATNTHPNNVAHEIESTIIENFLRSI